MIHIPDYYLEQKFEIEYSERNDPIEVIEQKIASTVDGLVAIKREYDLKRIERKAINDVVDILESIAVAGSCQLMKEICNLWMV